MKDSKAYNSLSRPVTKKWYTRPMWIIAIIILFSFLGLSIASGIYVYVIYKGYRSGKFTKEQIFGNTPKQNFTVYGDNRPSLGDPEAQATLVVFMDYQCENCKNAYQSVRTVMLDELYKSKVKFVFRHFPLTILHSEALYASLASECAYGQGKFFEMSDALFDSRKDLSADVINTIAKSIDMENSIFTKCLEDEKTLSTIKKDMEDGASIGIKEIPSFLIQDRIIVGAPTPDELKQVINFLNSQQK